MIGSEIEKRDPRSFTKLVSMGTKKGERRKGKTRGARADKKGGWEGNREYYRRDGSLVHISSYTYK